MAVSARVLIASALALSGCNVVFGVDGHSDGGASSQCTPELVSDGLSGWYPLKALDGATLPACVGVPGTCEPAACPDEDKDGVYGSALRFSAGRYATVPPAAEPPSQSGALTVAFWLRVDELHGDVCPVRKVTTGGGGNVWGLCLRGLADGAGTATARWTDAITHAYVTVVRSPIAKGSWMHVVMRSDGTRVELLISGTSAGMASITKFFDYGNELRLGSEIDGVEPAAFDGALADLRVYNRVLTDPEIKQLSMMVAPQPL